MLPFVQAAEALWVPTCFVVQEISRTTHNKAQLRTTGHQVPGHFLFIIFFLCQSLHKEAVGLITGLTAAPAGRG